MAESLFSESWYRVANLKPRLRSHAEIHRHNYRGKDWYVLQNHSSGQFHRFSPEGYHIIGLMDGVRTLDEIWEAACANLGDDMPTQEEVIHLLSQLHQADVLLTDIPPNIEDLHRRYTRQKRARLLGQLGSPFAIRLPFLDPERFLSATQFIFRPLFGWGGILIWCLVVGSAILLANLHWVELTSNLADRVLAMENLVLLWLCYPVIKAFHEFGHAYAVRRWGGEVHEMGVMLLVFVPVPYVDASAATAFWEKRKRIMVGAAGILIEAFLAALAMWVWIIVEPGVVRALAYNVMIIAGVSTLLFNGNPLLRFDAYYILSDYLEIPNMGTRANAYIGYICKRYLLNMKDARNPASAPGETKWLFTYGIAAFGYRMFIMVRIAMFVAGKFFFIGIALAVWGVFSMLVLPLYKVLRRAFSNPVFQSKRKRLSVLVGICIGIVGTMLLAIPIPSFTVAQGILKAPADSQLYAGTDGFIKQVLGTSGQTTEPGDPLILCENPDLSAEVKALEAELAELESRHRFSTTRDRTEARILTDEIDRIKAELKEKKREKEKLIIRSPGPGVFLLPDPENLPNHYIWRGTPIGYVVDFSKVTALVVVPQSQVDRIRRGTLGVIAMPAESVGREYDAFIKREVPAASNELPSLALSLEGGGHLALDPGDRDSAKAFEKLFQFEVVIRDFDIKAIGERVYVRFEHEAEPIIYRWYRSFRRTLLSRFSV